MGWVRDRLRIKDATHVIADIAVPAGLTLVAQARNKLLAAAEPFDAERVAGERVRIETIRTSTDTRADDARLLARIEHLRDILAWTDELEPPASPPPRADPSEESTTDGSHHPQLRPPDPPVRFSRRVRLRLRAPPLVFSTTPNPPKTILQQLPKAGR